MARAALKAVLSLRKRHPETDVHIRCAYPNDLFIVARAETAAGVVLEEVWVCR